MKLRTTIPAKDGKRAGDLLDRDFTAQTPNRTWVTDFTYVRSWAGWVYVAFIVDCFAQRIVAWHASTSKETELVMTPLRMAIWERGREGHATIPGELIHHSDGGSQGGFQWSSQHPERGVWEWDDRGVGDRSRQGVGRCVRRDDQVSTSGACSGSFGGGSPKGCRARKRPRRVVCRSRSGRAGSATVAACHRSV